MVPKHTIYCLGEVLLALDADAPLAHAESFRPRLGGDAAVLGTGLCRAGRVRLSSGPAGRGPIRAAGRLHARRRGRGYRTHALFPHTAHRFAV